MSDKICSLVFLRRDHQILLAMKKRGFGANRYNGVGGKMDSGETIKQTMVRETHEEIGVTPLKWEKVALHDFAMNEAGATPWHMIVHTFIASAWDGEPVETEEMAPQWFDLDAIPYDRMWDDDLFWLPAVLAGRKLHTEFAFDAADKMQSCKLEIVDTL